MTSLILAIYLEQINLLGFDIECFWQNNSSMYKMQCCGGVFFSTFKFRTRILEFKNKLVPDCHRLRFESDSVKMLNKNISILHASRLDWGLHYANRATEKINKYW
jgi:hypothetical protein